jgi:hypothetical protein
VKYAYQVGGRDYRSTRLYVGRKVSARGIGIGVLQSGQSMLEPLNFANAKLALPVAIGFGGLGLLALLLMWQASVG